MRNLTSGRLTGHLDTSGSNACRRCIIRDRHCRQWVEGHTCRHAMASCATAGVRYSQDWRDRAIALFAGSPVSHFPVCANADGISSDFRP
jgi:hypothetical protein